MRCGVLGPQDPQFNGSLATLTQALLQSLSAEEHVSAHAPCEQTSPAAQTLSQPPQLFGSLATDVHTPLQRIPLFKQSQLPSSQPVPAAHRLPQPPQLELSVWLSTQVPPQSEAPAGHTHFPAWQAWAAGHVLPQDPQLMALV